MALRTDARVADRPQLGYAVRMDLPEYFQMLARYNRIANEKLFETCSQLDVEEYRKKRAGSFGSIHGLLNHLLLGDRIWIARFQGAGQSTPPLNQELFTDFAALRSARIDEDFAIQEFFGHVTAEFFRQTFRYTNNKGIEYAEAAPVAAGHFFNHQTHHRGQVHVMLSQTPSGPPNLDLHRAINP